MNKEVIKNKLFSLESSIDGCLLQSKEFLELAGSLSDEENDLLDMDEEIVEIVSRIQNKLNKLNGYDE